MKKLFCILLAVGMLTICSLGSFASAAEIDQPVVARYELYHGYVAGSGVALRSEAGLSNTTNRYVQYGDTFTTDNTRTYKDGYHWIRVTMTSGDHIGRVGYIATNYVTVVGPV